MYNIVAGGEDIVVFVFCDTYFHKGISYTAAHYVGERLNLSLADSEGFRKKADLYKVDVNGSEKSYKYNDLVSVTAEGEKDGKAFSYWERNGKIVCYDLTYSFYVSADSTVNAVYGQSSADKNVLVMANPCAVGGDKIAFFAERNIADEYTVIESGILLGQKEGLNLTNAKIKAVSKNVSNKGQFTIRKKNVGAGEKWYGVSYVIYADESGNIKTIYSNEVNMTL